MALEQTLALPKTILLCTPRNPITPSFSPNPQSSLRLFSTTTQPNKNRRLSTHGGVKCSADYTIGSSNNNGHHDRAVSPQYPRPPEIAWKKELCNSVQLIGMVIAPVQIRHFSSGKVTAWTRLSFKKSPTETTWIGLTFWEELAHVAFQHVEQGHQIYVSGRLISDTFQTEDGKEQTYYKVIVQQLNHIERRFSSGASYDGDSNSATQGRKISNSRANNPSSTEELWQAFFANPLDWWDNRKNKRNPKYPDFKHKDTGESLWIEGRYNPPWVKSQLAILDARMESFQDQNDSMPANFVAGDNYASF